MSRKWRYLHVDKPNAKSENRSWSPRELIIFSSGCSTDHRGLFKSIRLNWSCSQDVDVSDAFHFAHSHTLSPLSCVWLMFLLHFVANRFLIVQYACASSLQWYSFHSNTWTTDSLRWSHTDNDGITADLAENVDNPLSSLFSAPSTHTHTHCLLFSSFFVRVTPTFPGKLVDFSFHNSKFDPNCKRTRDEKANICMYWSLRAKF